MNDEHQLSIGYTYYIKGTETNVSPTVNVTLDRFDSNIDLSNYLDNYGTYKYTFNVNDDNFNSFSTSVNFDIYIAKLTTSKSLDHDTNGGTAYTSLDDAIIASQNMTSQSYIYVYGDAVIGELDNRNNDLVLGANTELYLPHNASVTKWLDYNPPTGESNAALDVNNVQISSTITKYITITILEGTQLTVNGAFTIGADRGQNAGASGSGSIEADTRSGYSEVILEDDVQVIVKGSIWCYGYIRGTGEIIANSGANIHEPFVITDWPGATKAGGVYGGKNSNRNENNRVPFSQLEVRHIEVKTTIKNGANLIGLVAIYTSKQTVMGITIDARWNTTTYPLIGAGAILAATDPNSNSYIVIDYNDITEQTNIQIFGNVMDNYGALNVEIPFIGNLPMSTKNLYFPISYKMDIEVMPGATFNINQKYKMMPGSEFYVHQGATVNVNGAIIVYKNYTDKNTGIPLYPSTYPNAKFTNAGTVIVNGGLAGVILGEDDAILDLSNASSLNLISKEGISSAGAADLLGSTEMDTFSAVQNLYAYNVSANSVSVDWNATIRGDFPSVLDNYALTNNKYTYKNSKWMIGDFVINFDTNGFEDIDSISVYNNAEISQEILPFYNETHYINHNGIMYKFVGWYLDSKYQQLLENYIITNDITIYAKYEKVDKETVSVTFNTINNTYIYYYDKNSVITLPTVQYDMIGYIYDNNNEKIQYYNVNNKEYIINGYLNSEYNYGEQITINSDIIINLDYKEIHKNIDYFEVSIIKLQSIKGSSKSLKKKQELIIMVFNNVLINTSNIEGYNCYTSYAYTPGKDGYEIFGIEIAATYGTISLSGQTLLVNQQSKKVIYFDGGRA